MRARPAPDESEKIIYVPYMCDHGYAIAAALEAHGLRTEALPPPDDESLGVGLDLCRGRECLPCFLTTGDLIRRARQPDFDPRRAILLLPTASGLCRFGQYKALQRLILDEHGLAEVEIISPTASNSYHGLGEHSTRLRQRMWQGVVAVDLLQKLVRAYRPYECSPGATDRVYADCLHEIVAAVRSGGGHLVRVMHRIATCFEKLSVDRSEPRPRVGVVGEIYLRMNDFSNQGIIRQLEEVGAEVVVASVVEWLYFTNWVYNGAARNLGDYSHFLIGLASDLYQRHEEHRLAKPIEHLLPNAYETPIAQVMRYLHPHYDPVLGLETEAGLTLGKAVEFARTGLCGILNIMPFGCMPGIVVAGLAPKYRPELNSIPWLDISFDAQGGTNIRTRLEAFIYQATQYQRATAAPPPPRGV